jgi:hypothetical protein
MSGGAGGDIDEEAPPKEEEYSIAMLSKLEFLIYKLRAIRANDPTAKVLVFSQFNQTLEWLQKILPEKGFSFRTLRGDMSMTQRKKALEDFQQDPPTTVFLLSMRAGAVGVNLTQANHVILMEPCLNLALEDQAIGRVHRMGQQRTVYIYKLVMKDSVEEKIVSLQKILKEEGSGIFNPDNVKAVEGAGGAAALVAGGGGGEGKDGAMDVVQAPVVTGAAQPAAAQPAAAQPAAAQPAAAQPPAIQPPAPVPVGGAAAITDPDQDDAKKKKRPQIAAISKKVAAPTGSLTADKIQMNKRQYDILFGRDKSVPVESITQGADMFDAADLPEVPEIEDGDEDDDFHGSSTGAKRGRRSSAGGGRSSKGSSSSSLSALDIDDDVEDTGRYRMRTRKSLPQSKTYFVGGPDDESDEDYVENDGRGASSGSGAAADGGGADDALDMSLDSNEFEAETGGALWEDEDDSDEDSGKKKRKAKVSSSSGKKKTKK